MDNNLGNKEIMARNIQHYMDLYEKDRRTVCSDLGISYTTFTDWVKGKTYPRIDKIELLANYFGVTKADLVEEHDESDPSDTYYLDPDARDLAEFLHKNPKYKVLFDASRKVKPEDIEFVKQLIDRMGGTND